MLRILTCMIRSNSEVISYFTPDFHKPELYVSAMKMKYVTFTFNFSTLLCGLGLESRLCKESNREDGIRTEVECTGMSPYDGPLQAGLLEIRQLIRLFLRQLRPARTLKDLEEERLRYI